MTHLTPDAAAKLARLQACLAELGLTPDSAHALLLAPGLLDEMADPAFADEDDAEPAVDDMLAVWQEDGHSAWADVLAEIPAFLVD